MLNYDEFKDAVQNNLKSYIPEGYENSEIQFKEVNKINQKLDAIIFNPNTKNTTQACPSIYINDLYSGYQKEAVDIEFILQKVMTTLIEACNSEVSQSLTLDTTNIEKNIIFQLINTEQNKELLKNLPHGLPHREVNDLSIIYRWVLANDKFGMQSALINNDFMKKNNLSEDDLYNLAMKNTRNILPPTITSMNDIMYKFLIESGCPEAEAQELAQANMDDTHMYVLTNDVSMFGAANILYDDVLQDVSQKINGNFYILPSSIHDVIMLPATPDNNPENLAEMVSSINQEEVELGERLSNQVYHYDRDTHTLTIVSDIEKSLDNEEYEKDF